MKFSPTRILTTIVAIDSEDYRRLPVRSSIAVPKKDIFKIIKELKKIKVKAPVRMGEIILKINNNGSQTSIIASMTIEK